MDYWRGNKVGLVRMVTLLFPTYAVKYRSLDDFYGSERNTAPTHFN